MKKITIAIAGELTKEELEIKYKKAIEKFDEPEYELVNEVSINLYYDGDRINTIAEEFEDELFNFSTVSRDMAIGMEDLMPTEEVVDKNTRGFGVYYNISLNKWSVTDSCVLPDNKHFRTYKKAELAAKLLNSYQGKMFGIKMGGDE